MRLKLNLDMYNTLCRMYVVENMIVSLMFA